MGRKQGDNNYANYVGFQAFSSDEPTHRINFTNWYLKYENNRPGFFLNAEKCFIAGGGKINARFSDLLTHAHLTPHPLIFGGGIPLFSEPIKEKNLVLKKKVSVVPDLGIYQYQYKIK